MAKYMIYSDYRTRYMVDTAETLEEVIEKLEPVVYREDAHYLIYKNEDEPEILSIWGVDEFEIFKEKIREKNKTKEMKLWTYQEHHFTR